MDKGKTISNNLGRNFFCGTSVFLPFGILLLLQNPHLIQASHNPLPLTLVEYLLRLRLWPRYKWRQSAELEDSVASPTETVAPVFSISYRVASSTGVKVMTLLNKIFSHGFSDYALLSRKSVTWKQSSLSLSLSSMSSLRLKKIPKQGVKIVFVTSKDYTMEFQQQ